jgi:DNA-binding PadR family transcriptional regulator
VLLPSRKEVVVLELLAGSAELYGLQMVDASRGALKRGTIYVTLSRMEKKAYLESRLAEGEASQGPPRRLYRITLPGRRALTAWQMVQSTLITEPAG